MAKANRLYLENNQTFEIDTGLYTVKVVKSYDGKASYTVIEARPDIDLEKHYDDVDRLLVEGKEVE